jgi:hypothetical protein
MRIGVTGHQDLQKRLRTQGAHHSDADAWRWAEETFGDEVTSDMVVLSSLAAGADQRLSQVALARGGRIQVLVPSAGYDATFPNHEDLDRYLELLDRASEVIHLGYPKPSEEAYFTAGKYVVDHSDLIVAVWDGKHPEGLGGTGDIVRYARERGRPVLHLDPIRRVVIRSLAKE